MQLTFFGAAREVTGSCTLVESDGLRFLVDCGLYQGGREADARNRAPFGFNPRAIDFVLLTHAHLDHCGLLPRLAAAGFRSPVYCTPATNDLAPIMLMDSAHIQEKEAAWAETRRQRGNQVAGFEPLYITDDVETCTALLRAEPYRREFHPHPRVRVRFQDAGHILGSAIVELWLDENGAETKLVFSGDLGQPTRPVVRDPTPIDTADVLIVESTYGNRDHKRMDATLDELVEAVTDTFERRHGNLIVPAFALGRTQELLVILADLVRAGRLRNLNVFVDSPLAIKATEVTVRHQATLDVTFRQLLAEAERGELPLRIRFTETPEDSKAINRIHSGAIIIAASGMCDGGRIKHHLEHNISRPECSVLFTGFQAAGTLGRKIVDGASNVKLFGEEHAVRAKIYTLGGLSAHADQTALLAWLGAFKHVPKQVFVNHGEAETAEGFAQRIRDRLRWNVAVPSPQESFRL